MKYIFLFVVICLVSCTTHERNFDGAVKYLSKINADDSNYYCLPYKDSLNKKGQFNGYYDYIFYKRFGGQNLSLKPIEKETYRLIYSDTYKSYSITINEDSIIISKSINHLGYYQTDSTKLSILERDHLRILQFNFPIEEKILDYPLRKQRLIILVKKYPKLLDEKYYHNILDKSMTIDGTDFKDEKTKFKISKTKFKNIVEVIDDLGYWKMPFNFSCPDAPMDGDGFSLEANTKNCYKFVGSSSCPSDNSNFPKICQKIIELAGLEKQISLVTT